MGVKFVPYSYMGIQRQVPQKGRKHGMRTLLTVCAIFFLT